MRSLFRKKRKRRGTTGLWLDDAGVTTVDVRRARDGSAQIAGYRFTARDDAEEPSATLERAGGTKYPVNAVLPGAAYQLLLVEAPEVGADELKAAVRWRIRDLIDFHIDDAVIDVFEMPEQARGGQLHMMYAVVARDDDVRLHTDAVTAAGGEIEVVDIQEMALRNVAALLPEDADGVALLCLDETSGLLTLTRQSAIYLTRRIEIGQQALRTDTDPALGAVASLALEVRRSLDYFESHYAQKPVRAVYVSGFGDAQRADLERDLSIPVRQLVISELVDTGNSGLPDDEYAVIPALGAALRTDPIAL